MSEKVQLTPEKVEFWVDGNAGGLQIQIHNTTLNTFEDGRVPASISIEADDMNPDTVSLWLAGWLNRMTELGLKDMSAEQIKAKLRNKQGKLVFS